MSNKKTQAEINSHNEPIYAEIERLRAELRDVQAKYDSLEDFKAKVQNHQDSFADVSTAKNGKLATISYLETDCNLCKIYLEGMKNTFWHIANNKFNNWLFNPFYTKIDNCLQGYRNRIDMLNYMIQQQYGHLW